MNGPPESQCLQAPEIQPPMLRRPQLLDSRSLLDIHLALCLAGLGGCMTIFTATNAGLGLSFSRQPPDRLIHVGENLYHPAAIDRNGFIELGVGQVRRLVRQHHRLPGLLGIDPGFS